MAVYHVETDNGTYEIETDEGQQPSQSFGQQLPEVAKQAAAAAIETSPAKLTQKFFQTDPATMQRVGGAALPIVGGIVGNAPGAMAGEAARQFTGTALAPDTVPQTPLGRAASMLAAGVAQEPSEFPGASQVGSMVKNMVGKVGNGLAKAGQTLSGAKSDILEQAANQGYSTYAAPSMQRAQEIFGQALGPEGRAAMKQTAAEAFDPAVQKARTIATDIGTKLEEGKPITAIEALQARQATDRVISATPVTDKVTRSALYDWRAKFDQALANQSGDLSDASKLYRQSIVKDQLLSPTRLNKSGEPSAFLPMLVGHGMMGKGIEAGLGMLTGTSPAVWGLGATTAGEVSKGLNVLGQNPTVRQALLGLLERLHGGNK